VFKKATVVLLSIISVSLFYCEEAVKVETEQKKIQEYLKDVQVYNAKQIKSFTATLVQSQMGGTPITSKYYQKNTPDEVNLTRIESNIFGQNSIILSNRKGMFNIIGDKAINLEFVGNMNKGAVKEMFSNIETSKVENDKTTFTIEELMSKDIPYVVIGVKTDYSDEHKKAKSKMLSNAMPKEAKKYLKNMNFEDFIPFVQEYYIGKVDKFIYKIVSYNLKGKAISKISYESVELNCDLKDEIFEVPSNMKIEIIKNAGDMFKSVKK